MTEEEKKFLQDAMMEQYRQGCLDTCRSIQNSISACREKGIVVSVDFLVERLDSMIAEYGGDI